MKITCKKGSPTTVKFLDDDGQPYKNFRCTECTIRMLPDELVYADLRVIVDSCDLEAFIGTVIRETEGEDEILKGD